MKITKHRLNKHLNSTTTQTRKKNRVNKKSIREDTKRNRKKMFNLRVATLKNIQSV